MLGIVLANIYTLHMTTTKMASGVVEIFLQPINDKNLGVIFTGVEIISDCSGLCFVFKAKVIDFPNSVLVYLTLTNKSGELYLTNLTIQNDKIDAYVEECLNFALHRFTYLMEEELGIKPDFSASEVEGAQVCSYTFRIKNIKVIWNNYKRGKG